MKLPEIYYTHEPEWKPLIKVGLPPKDYMFIGKVLLGVIWVYLYKHITTRRYINLDGHGGAYTYKSGKYHPISMVKAVIHVLS